MKRLSDRWQAAGIRQARAKIGPVIPGVVTAKPGGVEAETWTLSRVIGIGRPAAAALAEIRFAHRGLASGYRAPKDVSTRNARMAQRTLSLVPVVVGPLRGESVAPPARLILLARLNWFSEIAFALC